MIQLLAAALLAADSGCTPPSPATAQAPGVVDRCAPPGDRFARGRALLDAGDCRDALPWFESIAPEDAQAAAAALLAGICHYDLGEDEAAVPLLRRAADSPELEDSASLFLGLVALREGDGTSARNNFDRIDARSTLRPQAEALAREAALSGHLGLSALAEAGYDSNATLAPSGAPSGGDGLGQLSAAALFRPLGESGPFGRVSGLYRAQLQLHSYDAAAFGAAAGWQLGRAARHLAVEYDFDDVLLGGGPYLTAHRLAVAGQSPVGPVTLGAAYAVRFESYSGATASAFSGTLHSIELWGSTGRVELGYHFGRDATVQAETSFFEHGPRAQLRIPLDLSRRLGLEASCLFRGYDAVDPAFGLQRSDVVLDASALGEWELPGPFTARAALGLRRAFSNASELSYTRIVATLGLAAAWSGL